MGQEEEGRDGGDEDEIEEPLASVTPCMLIRCSHRDFGSQLHHQHGLLD